MRRPRKTLVLFRLPTTILREGTPAPSTHEAQSHCRPSCRDGGAAETNTHRSSNSNSNSSVRAKVRLVAQELHRNAQRTVRWPRVRANSGNHPDSPVTAFGLPLNGTLCRQV